MSTTLPILNGRYRLDRQVGQGGFARVYLATDLRLDRRIAVKVLDADLASGAQQADFLARFEREAKAIAALDHDHILRVYDYGEVDGRPYLVLPFVDGGGLDARLQRAGRLRPDEAAAYLRQVAAALDYAHARGIVHRDIKPQNLLLRAADDRLLLADFGIAKLVDATSSGQSRSAAIGTVAYMAPEQFQGQVTRATDIYALGCLLFQCLTGAVPYRGTTEQVLYGHLMGAIPSVVALGQGSIPAAVQPVIARALAKQPQDRFASAGDLAHAFDAALAATRPTPAPPAYAEAPTQVLTIPLTRPHQAPTRPITPAAPGERTAVIPQPTHPIDGQPAIALPGLAPVTAGSADSTIPASTVPVPPPVVPTPAASTPPRPPRRRGLALALAALLVLALVGGGVAAALGRTVVGTGARATATPVPPPRAQFAAIAPPGTAPVLITALAWSPDGATLATGNTDGLVRLVSDAGALVATLDVGRFVSAVAWSPDSKRLAVAGDQLRLWDASGTPLATFTHGRPRHLAWSPDGATLAVSYEGDTSRLLTPDGTVITTMGGSGVLAWSPDGRILAGTAPGWKLQLWDARGNPLRTLEGTFDVRWSADGAVLATQSREADKLLLYAPSGTLIATLPGDRPESILRDWAWSPTRAILAGLDGTNVRLWDATGRPLRTIAGPPEVAEGLAWSPDGHSLATVSREGAYGTSPKSHLRLWQDDGTPLASFDYDGDGILLAWSPKGTILAADGGSAGVLLWR